MKTWLMIFFPIFFVGACSMPETRIYRLDIPANQVRAVNQKGNASVAVAITSPRHLSQPYIVYSKSAYELTISRYSRWDIPPDERVREVFKDAVSAVRAFKEVRVVHHRPEGFYFLKIDLRKFERTETEKEFFGELLFDVTFVSPEGKELFQSTISKRSKLKDRSFSSLAEVLSGALEESVAEVKASIGRFVN